MDIGERNVKRNKLNIKEYWNRRAGELFGDEVKADTPHRKPGRPV
jgi:hypothetical protein